MTELIHGDCIQELAKLKENSVDLILTDLPYGCGKTAFKWDAQIPIEELWTLYRNVIKDDGVIVLFGNEPFTSKLVIGALDIFRYKMIWKKDSPTGFLNCNYRPLSVFEDILVFSKATVGSLSKNPIRYFPQGTQDVNIIKRNNPKSKWRQNKGYGGHNKLNSNEKYTQHKTGYPTDILCFARDKEKYHPTQKPVALLEYLIKTYTRDEETVLDSCMGSGSTGIACLNTNRNFIGMELDEKVFNIAKERITNREAELYL